ncbi:MAG TPA: ABC transporter permease [Candidatus Acidoferrales bacterium]|nr:ABC transporter permease [Candidatus Acidoferrales bacterium]
MTGWARFRSWLRATLERARMEREMDAEFRFHIEKHAEELMRGGLPREEAQRRARIEFGGIDPTKEACREARGAGLVESFAHDMSYGLRMLRKNPGFASLAVMTLALGIGATTAMFSLVNAALLRALPYREPERLVYVWEPNPHIPGVPLEAWGPFNGDFYDWKKQSQSFTRLALFTTDRMNLSVAGEAARVCGSRVTGEFFQVLGISPELGRAVEAEDDQPGKGQVAVISHALWQSLFGADRGVLGRELLLNARQYRIIGVMPAGFAFPHGTESLETTGKATEVWVPWAMTAQERASRDDDPGTAIGRMRPGVSVPQVQAEMSAITARLDPLHPPPLRGSEAAVRAFDVSITGASRRALLIFMAAVVLVLLIACSNVASLVLARANARTLEINVRTALGASRMRLVRQLLAESLCLAGAGGIVGVVAAYFSVRFLILMHPGNIPRIDETSIDGRVLLFTVCASLATVLLFGLLPALTASRCNLSEVLKSSGRRSVKGTAVRLQRRLMIGEVALTFVLLAGSGLLIRSFQRLQSVDKGFVPSSTVTMNIQLDARYNRPELQDAFFRKLIDRTRALPGVEEAAAITYLPLGGGESISLLEVEGHPFDEKMFFEDRAITPRYFAAMGTPLVGGRAFTDDDAIGRPRVAIVSQNFARKYFPGQDAVGKRFHYRDDNPKPTWLTIVGIVGDVRQANLESAPPMEIYTPLWQTSADSVSVVARSSLGTGEVASAMRSVVRDLDPAVAVADVRTMSQLVSEATAERRFQTILLTAFGAVALFLSLVGLYAVMAYSVEQRTGEIGIRMALGAQRSSVMRLVLKQGFHLALAGIGLGFACAWGLTRTMSSLLFEVKPTDAPTFFGVAVLFGGVALAACYMPARRATRVDPMVALRYE